MAAGGFAVIASMHTGSGLMQFEVGLVLIGGGAALAMTPATTAIISSLPRAKQGVASAANDTAHNSPVRPERRSA